ncbi:MAG: aminotransferase class V-fold PLP-dependent enzyme [Proteobacteria bacterium]|nr:aminotransferase class V-fold PLP-dependent enzyme [Pseudomonadota bacterium]NIS71176.1 aminotransferase class V-fold PLP-dependent enzyme [Pseudomonadota bacterium]
MAGKTVGTQGLVLNEPLVFEQGAPERTAFSLPQSDMLEKPPEDLLPRAYVRQEIQGLPEMSEVDVVRHYTRLSQWNYAVDLGFYPLGSCTMKYNPKINEDLAALVGFTHTHPYQGNTKSQGILRLMYELQAMLAEIVGLDAVSLQPSAGAHGELTGMLMIRAYHADRGSPRKKVIIPDSAHGTNPASSALCDYQAVSLKSDSRGLISPDLLAEAMEEDVAALMLTNPNTLGLFEEDILKVTEVVHAKGGLVYCDGANLNALVGIARFGDMGIDVVHLNLHKTFSTPHGGGGPGAGPVAVRENLAPYLPIPVVDKEEDQYVLRGERPKSIGKVRAFHGSFGILVRAYAYILSMGAEGLKEASQTAVVNANYLRTKLKRFYHLPYDRICKHECVFSDKLQNAFGVQTIHIAKRLMDYGFHPPTIYFPLIVHGALMIEPTETESKETLDQFVAAMEAIAGESQENPDIVINAPQRTKVTRLDETQAARFPCLTYSDLE